MTNRMRYGACITYRPIAASLVRDEPDSRPVERLPGTRYRHREQRNRARPGTGQQLQLPGTAGYRIEAIERYEYCARFNGTGKVRIKPRGWWTSGSLRRTAS